MSGEVKGIPELKKALEALPRKLQNQALRKALRAGAKTMAAEVSSRAPEDTGAMKKSVKVRAARRKKGRVAMLVDVTGGHDDSIIGFTEFGRLGQPANPLIRESFKAKEDQVRAQVLADLARAIEAIADAT